MPIYQYSCSKCDNSFELRQGFDDENVVACPKCKCEAKRRFMPVPIIFKGSGFYVTDSRRPSDAQLPARVPETSKEVTVSREPEQSKPAATESEKSKPAASES
ncbi:MAG: FmdB family transcriptional regulator [Chloroflexi bacterium]|nr:FmdB family transcriptional regulator [Chloroflexota bacterium]